MTKYEFLGDLSRLLSDLPKEERTQAMRYYEDYFADAGEDMEEAVIEELGSPAELAKQIKEGASEQIHYGEGFHTNSQEIMVRSENIRNNDSSAQEYGDVNFETHADGNSQNGNWQSSNGQFNSQNGDWQNSNGPSNSQNSTMNSTMAQQNKSKNNTLLIIILVILTSPIWATALISVLSALLGLIGGLFGILCALIFGGGGVALAGIACIIGGIIACFTPEIASGILTIGIGLVMASLGSIIVYMTILGCFKLIPPLTKQLSTFFHWCSGKIQSLF